MDGPLFDDWYFTVSLSPPVFEGAGPHVLIRWNEPGPLPDQRRGYNLDPALDADQITDVISELALAYIASRASGIRRAISSLERRGRLRC